MADEEPEVSHTLQRLSALLGMGRIEDAQRDALAAVAREPNEDRLWSALAAIENRRSDYAASVYAAERSLALNPDNVQAMIVLGPALFHSGRRKDARAALDQLVAIAPEWAPGLVQRASIYSWTVRTEADRNIVRANGSAALALDPHNAEHYGLVAEAHFYIRDVGMAARLLAEGLRLDPTSESLLLKKARFGNVTPREAVELARTILQLNPVNVHALRLLHVVTWRQLMRLAAWPSIVGALSATLAYAFFLWGGGDNARTWLGILLVPAGIAWASMVVTLRRVARPNELAMVFRAAPAGLLGFVITILANVSLIIGVARLFVMPLGDPASLAQALSWLSATVTVLAAGDMVIRVAASRRSRRTGIYSDTPEGKLSAAYATRGQFDGTFGRLGTSSIVLAVSIGALWMPGVAALGAIAAALIATVLVKAGTTAVLRRRRTAALWFVSAALVFASAVSCVVLQLVSAGL